MAETRLRQNSVYTQFSASCWTSSWSMMHSALHTSALFFFLTYFFSSQFDLFWNECPSQYFRRSWMHRNLRRLPKYGTNSNIRTNTRTHSHHAMVFLQRLSPACRCPLPYYQTYRLHSPYFFNPSLMNSDTPIYTPAAFHCGHPPCSSWSLLLDHAVHSQARACRYISSSRRYIMDWASCNDTPFPGDVIRP